MIVGGIGILPMQGGQPQKWLSPSGVIPVLRQLHRIYSACIASDKFAPDRAAQRRFKFSIKPYPRLTKSMLNTTNRRINPIKPDQRSKVFKTIHVAVAKLTPAPFLARPEAQLFKRDFQRFVPVRPKPGPITSRGMRSFRADAESIILLS